MRYSTLIFTLCLFASPAFAQSESASRPESSTFDARRTSATSIASDPLDRDSRAAATMANVEAALTRQQQQPDDLKAVALLTAKVKELTEANAALKEQLVAAEGEKKILTRLIEVERERGDLYFEASKTRKEAGGTCDLIVAELKAQLARADNLVDKQQAEINRLRNPSFFSELFNPKELFKVGGSFALGRMTCGK